MLNKKHTALIVICFALVGCMTPYGKNGLMGGYTDMALNEDTYHVTFNGNAFTSSDTVQGYALRHSAELTLEKGYKYFLIATGGTSVSKETMKTPTRIETTGSSSYMGGGSIQASSYGNSTFGSYSSSGFGNSSSSTTIYPGMEYSAFKYKTGITIKMLHDNKKFPQAYDAKIILSNYENKNQIQKSAVK